MQNRDEPSCAPIVGDKSMVAWLMRLILLIQFLIGAGIYASLTARLGLPPTLAAILSIALVISVRLIVVANNFFLAHRYRSPLPAAFRLDWRQALALFFSEARATLTASSWNMPFRRFHKRVADQPETPPVLLVHGYGCNSGYWRPMSNALSNARVTHFAIDMEPVFGGIDEYVPQIHKAIEELCRETGSDRIVIVAHSMGGLAARAYVCQHGSARLAKIITLGTPHHGTALALFGVGVNSQQMHWTLGEQEGLCSDWLRDLAEREDPDSHKRIVSIYSHHDNIISPQVSSHLPGARNIELHGIGHVALASNPAVQAHVIRESRSTDVPQLRRPSVREAGA